MLFVKNTILRYIPPSQCEKTFSGFVLALTFWEFSRLFCPTYQMTVIHTLLHWWWWLPCKMATRTSGVVWGLVSCPRTLWHADQGNGTSDLPITRCWFYPWATAALSHTATQPPVPLSFCVDSLKPFTCATVSLPLYTSGVSSCLHRYTFHRVIQ